VGFDYSGTFVRILGFLVMVMDWGPERGKEGQKGGRRDIYEDIKAGMAGRSVMSNLTVET